MVKREPLYPHTPKRKEPLYPHRPSEERCLQEKWSGDIYKITGTESHPEYPLGKKSWYRIRRFSDGSLKVIPDSYIPYSYSFSPCPRGDVPPPPRIKVGDCVELAYGERGNVLSISPDGTVEVEIDKEIMGVKGRAFPDIYELRPCQLQPQTLLAKTEGDPISKYCCQLCGECAPEELLEEGRFLDRISWLRRHYKEKHPGMWGKMSPMTVEDGELIPPQYHHLADLVSEPLPKDAY